MGDPDQDEQARLRDSADSLPVHGHAGLADPLHRRLAPAGPPRGVPGRGSASASQIPCPGAKRPALQARCRVNQSRAVPLAAANPLT